MALQGIRCCVFDAYGTLFDVHAFVDRIGEKLGGEAAGFSQLWRRKQLEYAWIRSLMGSHADFAQVTSDALDHTFDVYGLKDAEFHEELLELYFEVPAYPDAKECIEALKSGGMRRAILSNGTPSMLDAALKSSGLTGLFEKVLSVEEVGIYKPSRRAYRLAVQQLKLDVPLEICFVSSNTWDVQSAAVFGFQSVWINRDGAPADRIPGKPTAIVPSLAELPAVLVG